MQNEPPPVRFDTTRRRAMQFIVLLGVVSLFADMTYEGGRSIAGQFLQVTGASAALVGLFSGAGELAGYGLRYLTGRLADRTRRYWGLTIGGYLVNLFSVPLIALARTPFGIGGLYVAERIGKAVRVPARDAMLSHATKRVGTGYGFGLHEALDQVGAVAGPLFISALLFIGASMGLSFAFSLRLSFAFLAVPACFAIAFLLLARRKHPDPREFEPVAATLDSKGLSRQFWTYVLAAGLVAVGYADFTLMAYHFQLTGLLAPAAIPALFAVAMAVDAGAALAFGRLFDRVGIRSLAAASALSWLFAPLVFLGDLRLAIIGVAIWGVGMGAQESIMRAAVAHLSPSDKRASAYGLFNMAFGAMWFAGSVAMGLLYDLDIRLVVVFSAAFILASLPIFLSIKPSRTQA